MVKTKAQVLAEVGAGLAGDEFEPAYQPIVSLPDHRLLGFEALARWRRPDEGLLPPSAFQDALNDPVLESRISETIAAKMIADTAEFKRQGFAIGRMAFNLGARQLSEDSFADGLLSAAAEAGLGGEDLTVEVRETSRLDPDTAAAHDSLHRLAAAGVLVALDDFGTGYACLSYALMPFVKRLKIDMSFTRAAKSDRRARAIVRRCVDLAGDLGFDAIAEGVEDAETEQVLIDLGCDGAQGYYYARPASFREVAEKLRSGGYGA